MNKCLAKHTAAVLNLESFVLARRLGISLGALQSWNKENPPEYARLAMAALVVGIDPDQTFSELKTYRIVKGDTLTPVDERAEKKKDGGESPDNTQDRVPVAKRR
jgi:transcriptional regulator with XRE-family HTH domain